MNETLQPAAFYQQRVLDLEQTLQALYKRRTILGWVRFAIIAAIIFAVYATWHASYLLLIGLPAAGIAMFLFAVSRDADNKEEIDNLETLVAINKNELLYTSEKYDRFYDGKNLEPEHHGYASDLDLFGKASLFQYINRCNAEKAKALLAQHLLEPLGKEAIIQNQEAVKELAVKPFWRQQLQAFGNKQKISENTEKRVAEWLHTDEQHFTSPFWGHLLYLFPIVTLSSFVLYLADVINGTLFLLAVFIFYIIALSISKKITTVYTLLSRIVPEINVLYKELDWFEQESFNSRLLHAIQAQIKHHENIKASYEIRHLKGILNRFDVRLNVFAFIILNTFLLWDLWQMMALKKWKEQNSKIVPGWFKAIAEIEVLNSLATLSFNHTSWHFPQISDGHFVLSGTAIGHPLIPEKQRINNSFTISGTAKVDLITGSNMAGKSTFLRSLGINMVLAYCGAPVCADSFALSVSRLMSSMRITDNLAENTSTFYAELKKLKSIIDAVNNHEKVFILLDEILRGTNSLDRHTGSVALIKQLIRQNAVALIATHDVALAVLENEYPSAITNYHFDVQVAGEELYFDYKLKEGICTSLNASILMKKIGIEIG